MTSFLSFVIHWNANPVIIQITDSYGIRWYSLLYGLAFLLGYYILQWEFKKENKNPEGAEELLMYMFFAVLIGARLGHCFFYDWDYYKDHLLEILQVWKGGLASHGAAIAIPIALYLYKRRHPDQSYLWIIDRVSIPTALGASFVRYGNFFNHEIVGIPTNNPNWGVIFMRCTEDNGIPTPRYPAQLFEAFLYDLIFIILLIMYKRANFKPREGTLMSVFLFIMFIGRFFIESVKYDRNPFHFGSFTFTHGQLLSIPFIIVGFFIFYLSRKQPKQDIPA